MYREQGMRVKRGSLSIYRSGKLYSTIIGLCTVVANCFNNKDNGGLLERICTARCFPVLLSADTMRCGA